MKILDPQLDLDNFIRNISIAKQRTLLLDYDGTLAPFRVERDQAIPYPGVREALAGILKAGHTRLVVISGRAIHDLIPLLQLDPLPEVWGSHGWERQLPNGTYTGPEFDENTKQSLLSAHAWIEQNKLVDRCEYKPASIALHWRGLDNQAADEIKAVALQGWSPLAQSSGLSLKPFDGGLELSVAGKDKGVAVRTILAELSEDVVIAYLGDDRTDEDAFEAIKGRGQGILVRSEFRPTTAALWLRPPEELLAFLAYWQ
jgi:trehalose 6-phosphate phosphatase